MSEKTKDDEPTVGEIWAQAHDETFAWARDEALNLYVVNNEGLGFTTVVAKNEEKAREFIENLYPNNAYSRTDRIQEFKIEQGLVVFITTRTTIREGD